MAHSSGSALVRHALMLTRTRNTNRGDGDQRGINWWEHISMVIHIGGITRGWQFNSEMPKEQLWLGPIARLLFPYWFPWQLYRGSSFITNTRIGLNRSLGKQLIREQNKPATCPQIDPPPEHNDRNVASSEDGPIPVKRGQIKRIYLLGTEDEYLSPADIIEVGRVGRNDQAIYIEVEGGNHNTILANNKLQDFLREAIRRQGIFTDPNLETLRQAINKQEGLREIPTEDIDDYLDPMDNEPAISKPSVTDAVIVMHGIRDNGFWAKRIANRIKTKAREKGDKDIRVISLSYGYFSLWDFLRPGGRRQAVEWFQDIYADICSLYPKADVHFIGHSNGTYLGCHALQCSRLNYKTMILAGSVVKKDFWIASRNRLDGIRDKITKTKTNKLTGDECKSGVERLVNFQAVDDWIVALLPGGLEALPVIGDLMNLGGAGAYGFQGLGDHEQQRISGDHGAAICPAMWDILAELVLDHNKKLPIQAPSRAPIKDAPASKRVTPGLTNQLWGYLRPLGGLAIIVALLISFSPWLIAAWKLKAPQVNALSTMAGFLLVLGGVSCLAQILAPSMKVLRQGKGARDAYTEDAVPWLLALEAATRLLTLDAATWLLALLLLMAAITLVIAALPLTGWFAMELNEHFPKILLLSLIFSQLAFSLLRRI